MWFHFLTIMEHTTDIIMSKQGLILSLLKVSTIFEFNLIDYRYILGGIDIRCINCKKATGSFSRTVNI